MMRSYSLKIGGQAFAAEILEYTETRVVVELNGNIYEVELSSEGPSAGAPSPSESGGTRGSTPPAEKKPTSNAAARRTPEPASTRHATGSISAPIPGVVKQILVAVGDDVTEQTVVIVLEAMKMENKIAARVSGKVTEIPVALGQSVQEGQLLMQVEVS